MNSVQHILGKIEIVRGNIVTANADAIVNTTDCSFSASGGIDYAIHKAAGKQLAQTLRTGGRISEGLAIITPAFEIKTAKWIIHTVGPKWKTGFCAEESLLADCYHRSLKLALENSSESIAFPCISVGSNGFPEERAAEIALNSVTSMLSLTEDPRLPRILFVCSSDKQEKFYKMHLKRMIIDRFLYIYSPETYHDYPDMAAYFDLMLMLSRLEWESNGDYQKYVANFNHVSGQRFSENHTKYDTYTFNMDTWDYNTCLSYIIFLQRSAYWSGGMEDPHYAQWKNGTVRKVLFRMRALLN